MPEVLPPKGAIRSSSQAQRVWGYAKKQGVGLKGRQFHESKNCWPFRPSAHNSTAHPARWAGLDELLAL